jgi:hypothetical protein
MTTPKRHARIRSFTLPTHWTPAQALAVWELLEDFTAALWDAYEPQLWDELEGKSTAESVDDPGSVSKEPAYRSEDSELPF